jgi:hypothetical protein
LATFDEVQKIDTIDHTTSLYQQLIMDIIRNQLLNGLPNPNVLPTHRKYGIIAPSPCRYGNHDECTKFSYAWVDKTMPFSSLFNFNHYLQCLQNNCVRDCEKTREFVLGYSNFEKINLTEGINSSVIIKLSVEDFNAINNIQIQKFQNNLVNTIVGNDKYIDDFYYTNNPQLLLHILQSSTSSIIVHHLKRKNASWWENVYMPKANLKKLISDNLETIKEKYKTDSPAHYSHYIEIMKYERSTFVLFAPLIQTNVPAMNTFIATFISSGVATIVYVKEMMEDCDIKIDSRIVESGTNHWLNRTKTDFLTILDLLIKHGLIVTKKVVMDLIKINKIIPNPELFGVILDEDIIVTAIKQKYFSYVPPFTPTNKMMEELCENLPDATKSIEYLEKYKSLGGKFTQKCMENATTCNNKSVIKYLIEVAKINVDTVSYANFSMRQESHILFDAFEPTPINHEIIDADTFVELNNEILTTITKCPKTFNETDMCVLNKRMKELLGIKSITIPFGTLSPQIIQYLINNQYVIGQYFVIDGEFANIMQMEGGEICHIDEVRNIAEYLVNLATPEIIQQEVGKIANTTKITKITKITKGRAKKAQ